MVDYIVDIIRATRSHPSLMSGASPRACNMVATAARAYAALHGRPYVIPDDVKALIGPAVAHRLLLEPGVPRSRGSPRTQVLEQDRQTDPGATLI